MRALFQSGLQHGKPFPDHGGAYSSAFAAIAIVQQEVCAPQIVTTEPIGKSGLQRTTTFERNKTCCN
jgi:hypothetical protein